MNTTLIERTGINSLEGFLLSTQVITPEIKKMDKYPIWDGELLVYNDSNFTADNLNVRVPIQVKSEIVDKEKNIIEKYSAKISHLRKYADEGGVLFIKVVVTEKNECYYYANLLMKADIIKLLAETKEGQETKTINLEEIAHSGQFITMCLNFKLHRQLQMQIPTINSLEQIKGQKDIYTYGYVDNIEDIVKKEHYGYIKVEGDILGYVGKIKTDALYGRKRVSVYTLTKKYYDYVTEVITENDHYYEINENAVITKDNKLTIHSFAKRDLSLDRAISNLEFVQDLYKTKKIKIGNSKYTSLTYEDIDEKELQYNIESVEKNLKYLNYAKQTFDMLHIATDTITIQDVIDIENEVCKIRDIIRNKEKIYFDGENNDTFVLIDQMKNITYLIYFIKQDDGTFVGYDYLNDEEIMSNLKIEIDSDVVQLSRYYNLKSEVIVGLNIDEKNLFDELKICTKNNETVTFINYLMMEFIKAYDLSKNNKYLNIASKINKLLRKQREFYSEELYKINNYQILKRRKKELDKEEKNKITIMKVRTEEILIKIACCLLLEQYDEFTILFKNLKKDDQELFKSWAIFNLLPDINKENIN